MICFYFPGSFKLERRMYFLEKNRRWSRSFDMPLEPSLMKELQFYEQKAKEMAEVLWKADLFPICIYFQISNNIQMCGYGKSISD